MDKKVPVFARIIAALQIVGASVSAVMMIIVMTQAPFHFLSYLIVGAMFVVFGFAFLCGIRLWQGEDRGYRGSMLVQALQIPVVHSHLLTYKFIFGFGVTVFFTGDGGNLNFEFGGISNLILLSEDPNPRFGVNIWAPILLAYLYTQPAPESADTNEQDGECQDEISNADHDNPQR